MSLLDALRARYPEHTPIVGSPTFATIRLPDERQVTLSATADGYTAWVRAEPPIVAVASGKTVTAALDALTIPAPEPIARPDRRIVCSAGICAGAPCLEGTRLYLACFYGMTREQAQRNFAIEISQTEWTAITDWLASPTGRIELERRGLLKKETS